MLMQPVRWGHCSDAVQPSAPEFHPLSSVPRPGQLAGDGGPCSHGSAYELVRFENGWDHRAPHESTQDGGSYQTLLNAFKRFTEVTTVTLPGLPRQIRVERAQDGRGGQINKKPNNRQERVKP